MNRMNTTTTTTKDPRETAYLASLDEAQRQALAIARDHLGSSFHVGRSNGFKEWCKKTASSAAATK
jgi:hypothetical protein